MRDPLLQQKRVLGVERLVAGAVVHAGGRVLVLRRSLDDDFLPGIEELPSGGCDPGETILEGLTRELQEEIGWGGSVETDPGFSAQFDYLTKTGEVARQYTFSVPLGDRDVRLSPEHSSWRWLVSRADVDTSDLTSETRQTVVDWFEHNRHHLETCITADSGDAE